MSGGFFRVIAAIVLVGLLTAIGVGVYNTGVSEGAAAAAAAAAAASGEAAPVFYYPGPYWGHGYGWGHGFGFFGIIFWILGIFLIFGLLRAAFGWGRWGGRGGPGGSGGWSRHDGARGHLDEWHRQAHGEASETK